MDRWAGFAGAVAAVASALTGLLAVAVSLNLSAIPADPRLPGRALGTLVVLAVPIFPALVLLVPDQSPAAVGVEVMVVLGVASPPLLALTLPSQRSPEQPREAWLAVTVLPVVLVVGGLAWAGVGMLVGAPAALHGFAVAAAASVAGGLASVWVLLVEIQR